MAEDVAVFDVIIILFWRETIISQKFKNSVALTWSSESKASTNFSLLSLLESFFYFSQKKMFCCILMHSNDPERICWT